MAGRKDALKIGVDKENYYAGKYSAYANRPQGAAKT
jgi:hypothetical protein